MEAIAKTDKYQQAWSAILPNLFEYTFSSQQPDQALDKADFESLDEGKKH